MPEPLKELEKLAARARQERTPPVDVTGAVLRRIRVQDENPIRPLAFLALASCVAAVVAALFSLSLLDTLNDPFWTLFLEI